VYTFQKSGHIPSTSVSNLIFTLANESAVRGITTIRSKSYTQSQTISQQYLSSEVDFIDLFLPIEASSASRAHVFLWLCYHYLESPSDVSEDDYDTDTTAENPFCDPNRPGKAPALIMLTAEEIALENVDPIDEKLLADKLVAQRAQFLQTQSAKESSKKGAGDDAESVVSVDSVKPKTKRAPKEKKTKSNLAHVEVVGETDSSAMYSREYLEEDLHRKSSADCKFSSVSPVRISLMFYTNLARSRTRPDQLRAVQDKTPRRYAPYKHDIQRRPYPRTNSPPRTFLERKWCL